MVPTKALFVLALSFGAALAFQEEKSGKFIPAFQVVRFPNDPCDGDSSKNGTCYTAEECSDKGGKSEGSCAEGYGVCCVFTLGCGSSTSENCTYFEVTSASSLSGGCSAKICKTNADICQIRLDFTTFVITGPNTVTDSYNLMLNGDIVLSGGKKVAQTGTCLTDTFAVSNQETVPVICGTMTGEHVYFEADDECNSLDFMLGDQTVGVTAFASRQWTIKVTQLSCYDGNLAPQGCDQYYYGSTQGYFKSFNYGSGSNRHLAQQHQTICFRREASYCKICYSADATTDISFGSFKAPVASAGISVSGYNCCGYGTKGTKTNSGGNDCVVIPGARKATTASGVIAASQCNHLKGLGTAKDSASKTVCSKVLPFKFTFRTDSYEIAEAAINEVGSIDGAGNPVQHGFKLKYFQVGC